MIPLAACGTTGDSLFFLTVWVVRFALTIPLVSESYAMSTEDVFKATRSAIVEIVTQDKSGSPLLTGTGFFISNDGKLVTNRHVVEGAATIVAKTERAAFLFAKAFWLNRKTLISPF